MNNRRGIEQLDAPKLLDETFTIQRIEMRSRTLNLSQFLSFRLRQKRSLLDARCWFDEKNNFFVSRSSKSWPLSSTEKASQKY